VCVFEREAWFVCDLWEDASVRSGWLQGLLNMLKHRQALDFICENGENCHHLSSNPKCAQKCAYKIDYNKRVNDQNKILQYKNYFNLNGRLN